MTGVDERPPKGDEAPESGFEGTPEEQIRKLRLENGILMGMVEVLKGADLGHLTTGNDFRRRSGTINPHISCIRQKRT